MKKGSSGNNFTILGLTIGLICLLIFAGCIAWMLHSKAGVFHTSKESASRSWEPVSLQLIGTAIFK